MQSEESVTLRALKTGAVLTTVMSLTLTASGHPGWFWGFLIGASLSLFSLFSLAVIVPFLFRPGASRHTQFLLYITLFMKLPLYCVGLYLITRLPGATPGAAVLGIALVPTVITLKTLGAMLAQPERCGRTEAPDAEPVPTQQTARATNRRPTELAAE